MAAPRYIVGIDLGTTNSAVAYVEASADGRSIQQFSVPQLTSEAHVTELPALPSFLYLAGAIIFGGAWVARPNRNLYYVGLLCLGSVAASYLIQPVLFAPLFFELTAMGAVLSI